MVERGPRYFATVLSDVIGVVPEDQLDLRAYLTKLKTTARYRAPEMSCVNWQELEAILIDAIGEPSEDWHQMIVRIVKGN